MYTSHDGTTQSTVYTSPGCDGFIWKNGTQVFGRSATDLAFDPINHIMYSANRAYGVYALKVDGQSGSAATTVRLSIAGIT